MWDSFISTICQVSDALIGIGLLVLVIVILYALYQVFRYFVETQLEPYGLPYTKAFVAWIRDAWIRAVLFLIAAGLFATLLYILIVSIFVW